jgi:hypothetical protein
MSQWTYNGVTIASQDQIPSDAFSFVYKITRKSDGKFYLGKKLCYFQKTTQKTVKLKNGNKKVKKIKSLVPSDWPTYWGSSVDLLKDVETLGEDAFTREILEFCLSKSHASYLEAKYQFAARVMEISYDETYNGIVNMRVAKAHVYKYFQKQE